MPFAALWFDSLHLSSFISGLIFAAPSVAIVLFTIFIGRWADRLADWRTAILWCNWIVLGLFCWFLFRVNSWDILVIWTLAGLFTFASGPIMDAAALSLTKKRGSDFGRIRAFGSVGFVVGVMAAGMFFDHFGTQWFVGVLIITMIARIIAAHALPHFRNANLLPADQVRATSYPDGLTVESSAGAVAAVGIDVLRHPGIALVIVGAALINASHGFNNVFAVIHWTNLGISTTMASILWSVGVIAEVLLMWFFSAVARRFSARKCLLFASAVCIARWSLNGTDPSLGQLFILQCLHSITFGLSFLACVNFISRRVPEEIAAQAQSVSATLVTFCMAVAMWLSGWLYEHVQGQAYWAMALMALLGGVCVALSFASNLEDTATSR